MTNRRKLDSSLEPPTNGPGRPCASNCRNVPEDIMRAAEVCLKTKNPQEISTKDIALIAGTRPTMVNYYFGSKDGLYIEIVRRDMKTVKSKFMQIKDDLAQERPSDPTRLLLEGYVNIYKGCPALCKILISEAFREESPIRGYLLEHKTPYARTMLADVIKQLLDSGYYRNDLDIESICTLIQSVVIFPLIVKQYFSSDAPGTSDLLDEQWVDFVSDVFGTYLNSSK